VYERSSMDRAVAGMGTTLTAALVEADRARLAHVGDSRAYLFRDGALEQLTEDHSLVEEFRRQGKLTEEEARDHPQKSIITRALGPEPFVEVDRMTKRLRDGDVLLLCSDGLTSMIHEQGVQPVLSRMTELDRTGRELIAAANEAGGRDNITVILFRLEEVSDGGVPDADGGTTSSHAAVGDEGDYEDFAGEATPGPRQGQSRPYAHTRVRDEQTLSSDDVAHAVRAADEQEAAYRASGTVALSAIEPRARAEPDAAPKRTVALPGGGPPSDRGSGPERRRRFRIAGPVVVGLVLLAMVLGGFWLATQAVYFVGTDEDRGNTVTIYRGLPVDLPLGLKLYSRYQGSGVTLQSIPASRRETFTDHKLRSKDDAENLVIQLERGQIDS
jgi:PPM family protein phosphatase